ncbi:hypothetical protein CVIRNUC_004079 [Coccomyxa viridis]|uniref:BRCA1-associated protein n=1 Tax=Coccomyxa viridis TaxID=1274662 RepID=A0AAV1I4Q0_9CHLO|nr:hypothetical protein CVIRNUC_004079 [Coccomyxa viridis]
MYALKVEVSHEASTSAQAEPSGPTLTPSSESAQKPETIQVSAGNPRVEHITGLIHLYRQLGQRNAAAGAYLAQDGEACTQLCVLSLPAGVGFANFCSFVAAFLPRIRELRVVRRESGRGSCVVLLHFKDASTTNEFYMSYNDKPFSSLEPEIVCRLLYVKEVEFISESLANRPALSAPSGQTELPTCPVCLERLDEHISGVATTVCNHRFHSECLQRWGDTSCPVCRYCLPSSNSDSRCASCSSSQDLWMCLICGHIGCGRYRQGHAAEHSRAHNHAYSLELEAQRVWDYTNDNYVHRLVQSKKNGKLLELPSPAPSSSHAPAMAASEVDSQTEEALVASKVDYLAEEYSQLLLSQLDEQRAYFGTLHEKQAQQAEATLQESKAQCKRLEAAAQSSAAKAQASERRYKAAESKLAAMTSSLAKTAEDRDFLKELNHQLELNQVALQKKCATLEEVTRNTVAKKNEELADLKEQVHDLMMYIEASRTIEAEGGQELRDASLVASPEAPQKQQPASAKRSSRRGH